jgi:putative oxidoreductase
VIEPQSWADHKDRRQVPVCALALTQGDLMSTLLLIGRILFGGYFLFSGINHFLNLQGMSAYAASHGVPMPQLAIALTGAMLLFGGLSVLLGFVPRIGLFVLLLFLVPVTFVMHNFWAVEDPGARMAEMSNFLKNLALTGATLGLMAIVVPWPASVDNRRLKGGRQQRGEWMPGREVPH